MMLQRPRFIRERATDRREVALTLSDGVLTRTPPVRRFSGEFRGAGEFQELLGAIAHPHHRQPNASSQLLQTVRRKAGELVLFQVDPDPLLRVQLRAVAGKSMGLETWVLLQERTDLLGPVRLTPVPDDHNRSPPDLALQMLQERDHPGAPDRSLPHLEVEAPPRGDPPDRPELRSSPLVDQHPRLPHRGPSLRRVGDERQGALVDEDLTPRR